MILLDTCILIDILRGRPEALALDARFGDGVSMSVISIQELLAGVRPKETKNVEALIAKAIRISVDEPIARRAGDLLRQYRPSHGLDPNDSLIAATAQLSGAELITCNLKHFPMFPDLKRPYP